MLKVRRFLPTLPQIVKYEKCKAWDSKSCGYNKSKYWCIHSSETPNFQFLANSHWRKFLVHWKNVMLLNSWKKYSIELWIMGLGFCQLCKAIILKTRGKFFMTTLKHEKTFNVEWLRLSRNGGVWWGHANKDRLIKLLKSWIMHHEGIRRCRQPVSKQALKMVSQECNHCWWGYRPTWDTDRASLFFGASAGATWGGST